MKQKDMAVYAAAFLIPLVARVIPELEYAYPLGADTPYYMYVMKYAAPGGDNFFYYLLSFIGGSGVDPVAFFKAYPALTFALTGLLVVIYVRRAMGWDGRSLVLLSVCYSLVPALLRSSWDLQRQSFALLLFALALVVETLKLDGRLKWGSISILYILIGLTHELVFAVALFVQLWKAFRLFRLRKWSSVRPLPLLMPLAVIGVGLLAYVALKPGTFLYYLRVVFVADYHPLGVTFTEGWQRLDWWASVGLLSYGFMIPLAILGHRREDVMTPWLLASVVPYLSFALSTISFNMPDRWLYLAGVPVAFYVADYLRKLGWRSLALYGLLGTISIQPLSMIGLMPVPLSLYAEKRYGTFTDLLSTSVPEKQIKALELVRNGMGAIPAAPSAVVVPYALQPWARYYFHGTPTIASDSAGVQGVIDSVNPLIYITYTGMVPPTQRRYTLLLSYGGLDCYIIT